MDLCPGWYRATRSGRTATALAKKDRTPTKLIEIENGTKKYMPLAHAHRAVQQGRAQIVNGRVRFLQDAGDSSEYSQDNIGGVFIPKGKLSGGYQVMQLLHRYPAGYYSERAHA